MYYKLSIIQWPNIQMSKGRHPWIFSFQVRKGKVNLLIIFTTPIIKEKKVGGVGGKGNENNRLKLGLGDSL